ncbi:hypothetical protein KCH_36790 [Kitasatospora cheerisanensis KCTC 2395]|uniref:Uncharacterized protein n=1 Tax=Kitasatospora cheerisanensis KCTC 2395 TaxID=1348663 RepID=A0A066YTM7_9ACTN|nr:hypothetical protein KCH_36790 [Kitasatospora cheerisanensis KCTC 2395]
MQVGVERVVGELRGYVDGELCGVDSQQTQVEQAVQIPAEEQSAVVVVFAVGCVAVQVGGVQGGARSGAGKGAVVAMGSEQVLAKCALAEPGPDGNSTMPALDRSVAVEALLVRRRPVAFVLEGLLGGVDDTHGALASCLDSRPEPVPLERAQAVLGLGAVAQCAELLAGQQTGHVGPRGIVPGPVGRYRSAVGDRDVELGLAVEAQILRLLGFAGLEAGLPTVRAGVDVLLSLLPGDLLDHRHPQQGLLVPERDHIADLHVRMVWDGAVPAVVLRRLVVVPIVATVRAVVPYCQNQPCTHCPVPHPQSNRSARIRHGPSPPGAQPSRSTRQLSRPPSLMLQQGWRPPSPGGAAASDRQPPRTKIGWRDWRGNRAQFEPPICLWEAAEVADPSEGMGEAD